MRKCLFYILAASLTLLPGCGYDDSSLEGRIGDLEERVSAIEAWKVRTDGDLKTLQGLASAVESGEQITAVSRFEGGATISFSKLDPITVYIGHKAEDGSDASAPSVSMKQDEDGLWYWTVNGEFVLCEGEKVPVHTVFPEVKIDGGNYVISYDGWATPGAVLGPVGTILSGFVIFDDIQESDASVSFFIHGQSDPLVIPKGSAFGLAVSQDEFSLLPGSAVQVNYTVSSPDTNTKLSFIQEGDITVTLSDGVLSISAGAAFDGGKIFLTATGKDGEMALQIITLSLLDAKIIYSVDGGTTWTESLPESFSALKVHTTKETMTAAELSSLAASVSAQTSPVALDLSEVTYASATFPAGIFSGSLSALDSQTATVSSTYTKLASIEFPSNVTEIAAGAFAASTGLTAVDLSGIETIGIGAFRYTSLVNLTIPSTVSTYGTYSFADISTLRTLYFDSPYDSGSAKAGNMFTFWETDTSQGSSLEVTVGPNVSYVPRCTFRHNNKITKLVVEGNTYFRQYSFAYCQYLAVIEFKSEDPVYDSSTGSQRPGCGSLWDSAGMYSGTAVPDADKMIIVPESARETYASLKFILDLQTAGYTLK